MNREAGRFFWVAVSLGLLSLLLVGSWLAPERLSPVEMDAAGLGFANAYLMPWEYPPFGTDERGVPLLDYALQGARIVTVPALASGVVVMLFSVLAGLVRCAGVGWLDGALQGASELVGALPRLVVVLVVALLLPKEWRVLMPIGLTWALLAAPGAMDEAAATAGRLGGERFVEALRAHGFGAVRIYLYHVVWLNLRPVIVRQGAEVMMQVVFLEIALSYMTVATNVPDITHSASTVSWAQLLYHGYTALIGGRDLFHALALGLGLLALVGAMTQSFRLAARAR
jgi:ABC-type dipeptide/oligopeptide/nickel transport system permease subunit